jgi:selenide,water dikinase
MITADQAAEAFANMAVLNKSGSEVALELGASACTDVTGFGLAGHLCEMAMGGKKQIHLNLLSVPVYPVSIELFGRGLRTGVTLSNKESAAKCVQLSHELPKEKEMILYDPQTSGPLLISIAAEKADMLVTKLVERGLKDSKIIAEVSEGPTSGLFVRDSI